MSNPIFDAFLARIDRLKDQNLEQAISECDQFMSILKFFFRDIFDPDDYAARPGVPALPAPFLIAPSLVAGSALCVTYAALSSIMYILNSELNQENSYNNAIRLLAGTFSLGIGAVARRSINNMKLALAAKSYELYLLRHLFQIQETPQRQEMQKSLEDIIRKLQVVSPSDSEKFEALIEDGISKSFILEPVAVSNGRTYDRPFIDEWINTLRHGNKALNDPIDRTKLDGKMVQNQFFNDLIEYLLSNKNVDIYNSPAFINQKTNKRFEKPYIDLQTGLTIEENEIEEGKKQLYAPNYLMKEFLEAFPQPKSRRKFKT